MEEKSRQILLDMKIQEILYTYLSYHWTIFDSYKKWLDEQVNPRLSHFNFYAILPKRLRLKMTLM